jgi:hypothetical protein
MFEALVPVLALPLVLLEVELLGTEIAPFPMELLLSGLSVELAMMMLLEPMVGALGLESVARMLDVVMSCDNVLACVIVELMLKGTFV